MTTEGLISEKQINTNNAEFDVFYTDPKGDRPIGTVLIDLEDSWDDHIGAQIRYEVKALAERNIEVPVDSDPRGRLTDLPHTPGEEGVWLEGLNPKLQGKLRAQRAALVETKKMLKALKKVPMGSTEVGARSGRDS